MRYLIWELEVEAVLFLSCLMHLEMQYGPRLQEVTYVYVPTAHVGCVMVCGN